MLKLLDTCPLVLDDAHAQLALQGLATIRSEIEAGDVPVALASLLTSLEERTVQMVHLQPEVVCLQPYVKADPDTGVLAASQQAPVHNERPPRPQHFGSYMAEPLSKPNSIVRMHPVAQQAR